MADEAAGRHARSTRAPAASLRPGFRRLRIDVAYDGSGFSGFARQKGVRTVQGVLEAALARVLQLDVAVTCAGRTDAGVHATGQVVHVDVPRDARALADLGRLRRALANLSGEDVSILRVRRVPSTFDARFSATRRRYRYRICDAEAIDPLERHRTWHVGLPSLDVDAMTAGAEHLLGEHDFSSFCRRAGDQHLLRRIDVCTPRRKRAGRVTLAVEGPAFCHQMVRSIAGTLVEVGRGRRPADWVAEVLAARDRAVAGPVAPPHGLTLIGVSYR